MRIDVITIFPEVFGPFLGAALLGKAAERGLVDVHVHDLRGYSRDRHRKVDDEPYGGGPGMVMKPEPFFEAVDALVPLGPGRGRVVLLSPQGRRLTQAIVDELAREDRLVLLCGRYEGVDERVAEHLADDELSIGDYVLSGGEAAALVVIDAVARLLPGVVGDPASVSEDSFAPGRVLDHPHYTRPASYRGMRVPEVLLSGHHAQVEQWRREQAAARTRTRRPDLIGEPDAGRDREPPSRGC